MVSPVMSCPPPLTRWSSPCAIAPLCPVGMGWPRCELVRFHGGSARYVRPGCRVTFVSRRCLCGWVGPPCGWWVAVDESIMPRPGCECQPLSQDSRKHPCDQDLYRLTRPPTPPSRPTRPGGSTRPDTARRGDKQAVRLDGCGWCRIPLAGRLLRRRERATRALTGPFRCGYLGGRIPDMVSSGL
jgi:hypothetical protein